MSKKQNANNRYAMQVMPTVELKSNTTIVRARRAVYRLTPPLADYDGIEYCYVLSSSCMLRDYSGQIYSTLINQSGGDTRVMSEPQYTVETLVFPSSATGEVLHWRELLGLKNMPSLDIEIPFVEDGIQILKIWDCI